MRIHPVAGVAALLFLLAGLTVAVRGEQQAEALQKRRDEILADIRRRAGEIEKQLSSPTLDTTTRGRLQQQLDSYKHQPTGIPPYFPHNARTTGYVIGVGLAAMGLCCLLYKPRPKNDQGTDTGPK
jgi:hypothetical protein